MCYPLCAFIILFAAVIMDEGGSEVDSYIVHLGIFVRFLQNYQDQEGCDLRSLFDYCSEMCDIASASHSTGARGDMGESSVMEQLQQREVCINCVEVTIANLCRIYVYACKGIPTQCN